jgi:hypothetical protein
VSLRRAYRWLERQPGNVRGAIMSVPTAITIGLINIARTPGVGVWSTVVFDLAWAGMVAVFLIARHVRQNRRRVSLEK